MLPVAYLCLLCLPLHCTLSRTPCQPIHLHPRPPDATNVHVAGWKYWERTTSMPRSSFQPMTGGSSHINTPAPVPLGWDTTEGCVLHWLPEDLSKISLQYPQWAIACHWTLCWWPSGACLYLLVPNWYFLTLPPKSIIFNLSLHFCVAQHTMTWALCLYFFILIFTRFLFIPILASHLDSKPFLG